MTNRPTDRPPFTATISTPTQTKDVIQEDKLVLGTYKVASDNPATGTLVVQYGDANKNQLNIHRKPFRMEMLVDGEPAIDVNSRDMFYFEHHRRRDGQVEVDATAAAAAGTDAAAAPDATATAKKIVDYNEHGHAIYEDGTTSADEAKTEEQKEEEASPVGADEAWEESFGGHTDSKPFGPASVGVDLTFRGAKHVYGIPEHATSLALKPTTGQGGDTYAEPYRLYNLDVFEYELDVPMALYGVIPLMLSHGIGDGSRGGRTVGAFWMNPTETFVDVDAPAAEQSVATQWMSESGVADLFLLPGPSPAHIFRQYADMTGTAALPPLFALAYHQCRWNYRDEADVRMVDSKFEEHDFPYDVLWLDIEHTDGKRYFTWDKNLFPNPKQMIDDVSAHGRKMVTIVDPHIKRDGGYYIHNDAQANGVYVQQKGGGGAEFDGWCWPGSSSYVDFTNPKARQWWSDQFAFDKYEGSTADLYTWNDMNEPSVFNGPEVSMQKDNVNMDGVEHREWHNMYGFYQQWATADGQVNRHADKNERPFVLSRAFFAGSQKHGAIWTGDNAGQWSHLKIAQPMILTANIAGLPFIGADVGGFFGNPDSELFTRWMQAGAYHPFFRAHAHHDSKRREPWVFGDAVLADLRKAVLARWVGGWVGWLV